MDNFHRKTTRKQAITGLPLCLLVLLSVATLRVKAKAPNQMEMYEDRELMRQEITKRIPIGSDVGRAKSVMQENGFGCLVNVNGNVKRKLSIEQSAATGKKTSLSCFKKTRRVFINRWMVNLDYQSKKSRRFLFISAAQSAIFDVCSVLKANMK